MVFGILERDTKIFIEDENTMFSLISGTTLGLMRYDFYVSVWFDKSLNKFIDLGCL